VISAASSADALIAGDTSTSNFDVDGQPSGEKQAWKNIVGEDFFQTMGIPMLSGRGFGRQDTRTSESVAVINRELANQFFRGQNPIGQTFNTAHTRIIGICGDTRFRSLRDAPPPTYYLFTRQVGDYHLGTQMTFAVKTAADPDAIAASVRTVVHGFSRDLLISNLRTQEEQIHSSLRQERLFASLTTGFGILSLLLASIGIYGVMAYTVARRTNEIGIRLALGAQANQILTMVLRETSWLAMIGVTAGLGAALVLTRFLASMLFGLKPNDPATIIASVALLFAMALLAGFVPARRASRIQPMQALRHE
jgi:predicted permease